VLARPPADGELAELVRRDVAGWLHLNGETLEILGAAHDRGVKMTLLSNAPHELADAVEALPELEFIDAFVFSARIAAAKPDAAAYEAALEVMGVPAEEVVFVDDREENVAGARAVGIEARRFIGPDTLRALSAPTPGGG
jgi:putative hydrolase of the HAD superfamily